MPSLFVAAATDVRLSVAAILFSASILAPLGGSFAMSRSWPRFALLVAVLAVASVSLMIAAIDEVGHSLH